MVNIYICLAPFLMAPQISLIVTTTVIKEGK